MPQTRWSFTTSVHLSPFSFLQRSTFDWLTYRPWGIWPSSYHRRSTNCCALERNIDVPTRESPMAIVALYSVSARAAA